jgi:hypothetical protein
MRINVNVIGNCFTTTNTLTEGIEGVDDLLVEIPDGRRLGVRPGNLFFSVRRLKVCHEVENAILQCLPVL